jgi:hypothetical protein
VAGGVATVLLVAGGALAASSFIDRPANNPDSVYTLQQTEEFRFPTNKQNEPTIAVNPLDSNLMVAGANDEQRQPACGPGPVRGDDALESDCSFFTDVGTSGVYTSSDGGATWQNRGLLPGFTDPAAGDPAANFEPGKLVSDGDPVVVYGPKLVGHGKNTEFSYEDGARAYYASLGAFASTQKISKNAPEVLTVSRSDDDGATWDDPVVAVNAHGHRFNDKENIWADNNPASPYFGRVYVSWTQFRDVPGSSEPVMITYSTDGGDTWARPNQLSIASNRGHGGRQGSAVTTGPDGTVYVIWEDSERKGHYKQVVATSMDGGATFTKQQRIAFVDDIQDPIPGANFRTDSFVSVATDQRVTETQPFGVVYTAWADELDGDTGEIVVSKSSDHGLTWSDPMTVSSATADGYAFFQGLGVAPNGRVDVGYQALTAEDEDDFGTGNASIDSYYVGSTDGGNTWSAPMVVSSESSDPAVSAANSLVEQFWGDYNTVVSSNSRAWFIYTDSRDGEGCPAVDAYQHLVADGTATPDDKPALGAEDSPCSDAFGDTDIWVSRVSP